MVHRAAVTALFICTCAVSARRAAADEQLPVAVDVSVGGGVTQTSYGGFASFGTFGGAFFEYDDVEFAVLLPAVSLRLPVSATLSVGGRVSNVWYVPDDGEVVNGYLGPELGWMPLRELLLGVGAGALFLGELGEFDAGPGADLRLAYFPVQARRHSFGAFAEFVPGYVSESFTYSAGAGVIWLLH
jgi:hypothetical protein